MAPQEFPPAHPPAPTDPLPVASPALAPGARRLPGERFRAFGEGLPFEHPGLALLVGVAACALALFLALRPEPVPAELLLPRATSEAAGSDGEAEPAGAAAASEIVVHAAGAVVRPGLYRLAPGSRVADLLEAAGGPAPGADLDQLNLAAALGDGERVLVLRVGQAAPAPPVEAGRTPGAKVDLNTATAAELDSLPGVGPATAEAIIRHRETRGRFRSVTDLLEVDGIGEAKLAKLRPLVRV